MGSKHMSSFPRFRVIRRLMRDMLDNRPTFMISVQHAPPCISNQLLWDEDKTRKLPGLRGAFVTIGKFVREQVANMRLDFGPQNKEYNSKFYFQQGNEDYATYIDKVFDRCADDGMPSTKLIFPKSSPLGDSMPLLVFHPGSDEVEENLPTNYYATCARRTIQEQVHIDLAGLYRPTIKKQSKQLTHKDEEDDRYGL